VSPFFCLLHYKILFSSCWSTYGGSCLLNQWGVGRVVCYGSNFRKSHRLMIIALVLPVSFLQDFAQWGIMVWTIVVSGHLLPDMRPSRGGWCQSRVYNCRVGWFKHEDGSVRTVSCLGRAKTYYSSSFSNFEESVCKNSPSFRLYRALKDAKRIFWGLISIDETSLI